MLYKIDKLKIIWNDNGMINEFEIGYHAGDEIEGEGPHNITIDETPDTFQIQKTMITDDDEIYGLPYQEILVIPKSHLRKWFIVPQP